MKVNYDKIADAMYIHFSDEKSTRTEEVLDDILVDYAGKKLVGIEVLEIRRKLRLPLLTIFQKNLMLINQNGIFISRLILKKRDSFPSSECYSRDNPIMIDL